VRVEGEQAAVPRAVADIAAGRRMRLVWTNDSGGLTFEIGDDPGRSFIKWVPAGARVSLTAEHARLNWASAYFPVPKVLGHGADEAGSWLVTGSLPGRSAIEAKWVAEPAIAVTAIGQGLRALHDTLPVQRCPFWWRAEDRVARASDALARGQLSPDGLHTEHRGLTVNAALDIVADVPATDRLVVCHGDACAPNTLIADDGRWCGHVDLGDLGVADRWADIAVATWSAEWNYGPGWEPLLLDAYGVQADPERTAYYRLLYDLTP
jgi:kanamycin kinase